MCVPPIPFNDISTYIKCIYNIIMCYNAQDINVDEHKKYMCVWVSIADIERTLRNHRRLSSKLRRAHREAQNKRFKSVTDIRKGSRPKKTREPRWEAKKCAGPSGEARYGIVQRAFSKRDKGGNRVYRAILFLVSRDLQLPSLIDC